MILNAIKNVLLKLMGFTTQRIIGANCTNWISYWLGLGSEVSNSQSIRRIPRVNQ